MESQPQNPEFRNNPENFHPCLPTADSCMADISYCRECINVHYW